jgi:two-component system, NarL family, response regulator DesR
MITVLLAHPNALLREALAMVLGREPDLQVVADARDDEETLVRARETRPDVAVVDIALPGDTSVPALCRTLCEELTECGILVLLDNDVTSSRALAQLAPRVGLIGTDASPAELVESIRQLAAGKVVLDPRLAVAALAATETNPLTEREREVLRLAVAGLPTKEIARRLHLSSGTVRNCLSRVLTKTGARTRLEAIRVAQTSGWI